LSSCIDLKEDYTKGVDDYSPWQVSSLILLCNKGVAKGWWPI